MHQHLCGIVSGPPGVLIWEAGLVSGWDLSKAKFLDRTLFNYTSVNGIVH